MSTLTIVLHACPCAVAGWAGIEVRRLRRELRRDFPTREGGS